MRDGAATKCPPTIATAHSELHDPRMCCVRKALTRESLAVARFASTPSRRGVSYFRIRVTGKALPRKGDRGVRAGSPLRLRPYIASGAEIPSSPSAAASVSCVARTRESRAIERSCSAGLTTRASR